MISQNNNILHKWGRGCREIFVLVMVAKWVKAPAVWCAASPGHVLGVVRLNPTGSMAGLLPLQSQQLIVLLINCILVRSNKNINI